MSDDNELIQINHQRPQYNVLFLHGFISSANIFKQFFDDCHFKTVNLYAFSYKDDVIEDKHHFNLSSFSEQLIKFIDHHQLDNLVIVAHSMGAGVLAYAYKHIKHKIKKIILVSPLSKSVLKAKSGLAFFNGVVLNNITMIRNLLYATTNQKKVYVVDNYIYQDYENFLANKKMHLKLGVELLNVFRLNKIMEYYSEFECDTFVFLGGSDKIIPAINAYSELEKLNNPNFQINLWVNVGHVCFIEEFTKFINVFKLIIEEEE